MAGGWQEPRGSPWDSGAQAAGAYTQLSPQTNQENPSHQKLASLHLEKYSFPVEMMICLPNGTVVGPRHPASAAGRGSREPGLWLTDLIIPV